MFYIYLPGFSKKNMNEYEPIVNAFIDKGLNIYGHQWRHWENENITWDVNYEVNQILHNIKNNDEEITIISKSLGSHVAVNLIPKIKNKIKLYILMGLPILDLEDEEKKDYYTTLSNNSFRLVLIHNKEDSHGNVEALKQMIDNHNINYELILKESNTHEYLYMNEIFKIIDSGN